MGNTLWVLEEGQESDNWDHSEILHQINMLNTLSSQLGYKTLSSYFDESIVAAEFGMDIVPKYFDAKIVENLLSAILQEIKNNANNIPLQEEIEDIIEKCIMAKEKNVKVQLALVP